MDDYHRIRPRLYPRHESAIEAMRPWADRQAMGEAVVWCTIEGFFWFPRTLMNFERLCLGFFDQPELIHQINRDLLHCNLDLIERFCRVCSPTFMTIAEDTSYTKGPMISKQTFEAFLAPCYRELVPRLQERNIPLFMDTDSDVELLVPWLQDVGIAGVLPLERQSGVDGGKLREQFPRLGMIGHFNKLVMSQGEAAMRTEFERLAPLMRRGGFIPSVDHQTLSEVSLEQYRIYLRLLEEYTGGGKKGRH